MFLFFRADSILFFFPTLVWVTVCGRVSRAVDFRAALFFFSRDVVDVLLFLSLHPKDLPRYGELGIFRELKRVASHFCCESLTRSLFSITIIVSYCHDTKGSGGCDAKHRGF